MLTADDGNSGVDSSNTPGPAPSTSSDSGNVTQPSSSAVPHGAAEAESKLEQDVNPNLNAGNVGAIAAGTQEGDVVSRAVANASADAAAVQQNENQTGDVFSRAVDRATSQSAPTAGGSGGASVNPFFHTNDPEGQTPSSSNDEQAKKSFGGPPTDGGTGGGQTPSGPNIFFHPKPVDEGSSEGGGSGGSTDPATGGTAAGPVPTPAATEQALNHAMPASSEHPAAGDGAVAPGVTVALPGMPHGAAFGISSITSEVQKNLEDVVTLPPTTNDTKPTTGFEGFTMGGQSAADPGTTQAHN